MTSIKRTREQTTYEIPKSIEKRLKMQNKNEIDMDDDVALQIRDDLIQYIRLHPHDVDSIYHTFLRFKQYTSKAYLVNPMTAILDPMNLIMNMPVEFGITAFMSVIQVIRLLQTIYFFNNIRDMFMERKLRNMFSLCTNAGFEILFSEIIQLYHQLNVYQNVNNVANDLYCAILNLRISDDQMSKFLDHVVKWIYQKFFDEDVLNSMIYNKLSSGDFISFLVRKGYHELLLDLVEFANSKFKSSNAHMEKWSILKFNH